MGLNALFGAMNPESQNACCGGAESVTATLNP
jgi:hypothetical protein